MKNGRNNASLGLPEGEAASGGPRIDIAPGEIDITKDRLSEILSRRRHQLGLKVEEIAEDIKIRADYLRAIEQEAFDRLPTPEYSRLFLKSYAERLGLNINEIYALYDLHHRPSWEPPNKPRAAADSDLPMGPTPRLPAAKPIPKTVWLYLALGILAIIIVVVGLMGLLGRSDDAEPVQQDTSSSQSSPVPPPETSTEPVAAEVAAPVTSEPQGEVIDAEMRLTLTFGRETWVKLVADTDTITAGIKGAGQSLEAKALDRFVLSLGHTDGVEASVNGRALKPFSSWTKGFGAMVITADSIAAWMLPAPEEGRTP